MVAVARKVYLAHPITPEWRQRVRDRLTKRGDQARLCEYIEKRGLTCSSGQLADLLSGKYQTSDYVEPIHEFFQWPAPLPPLAAIDAGEIAHGYLRMTKEQRQMLETAERTLQNASGDEAKDALAAMLRMLRATDPQND